MQALRCDPRGLKRELLPGRPKLDLVLLLPT